MDSPSRGCRRPASRTARRLARLGLSLSLSLALTGCGEPEQPPDEVVADAAPETALEPAPETALEPAPETAPEATPAATSDAAADVSPEAIEADDGPAASPSSSADVPATSGATDAPDSAPASVPTEALDESPDAGGGAVPETPAVVVDCASTLPCRLVPTNGGPVVTLTAADGTSLDGTGPLRIDVVLESPSRDATVAIERSSSVVTGGQVLEADTLEFGAASAPGAREEASFALVAGVPINAHATFAGRFVGNPTGLDQVTFRLTEAGSTSRVTFTDVPLGAERSAPVDCADTLPCTWSSADGEATIVLTDAVPARWNRATRLVVSWSFEATRPLEIASSGPGRVIGDDGLTLEPYGIELGGVESSDGTVLERRLAANEPVAGRTVPRRTPAEGVRMLRRVEIDLVERRSPRVPRWRPVFVDVPLRPAPP